MKPQHRSTINWTWIKKQYRLGFTYRQICSMYSKEFPGESVSHQRISQVVRKKKWKRDLTEDYEKAVERKVIERAKGVDRIDRVDGPQKSDEDTVEEAAEVAATTVERHRKDAEELRSAAMRVIREVDENEEITVLTRNGDELTIRVDVTKRAQALNNASSSLNRAVDIERKSLNLDKNGNPGLFGSGQFTIISNVPLPDPVPPGI